MKTLDTLNPTTGQPLNAYPVMSEADVAGIIEQLDAAQQRHRQTTLEARAEKMRRLGKLLLEQRDVLATLMTQEMGKPLTQARGEVEKCAMLCDFYADHTAAYLAPRHIKTTYRDSQVCYEPLGVIFAIMPWNFPCWQVFRFAIPTLMAGNTCLLKHAPNCTGTALKIEALVAEAGFETCFRSLVIDVDLAGFCIAHPKVRGVTLTGSDRAGKIVAAQSGQALKKVVLELGGSDPYLILEDADLDLAARECADSRFLNAGQICISAKRLIVVDTVRAAFLEKFCREMTRYQPGDPLNPNTTLGPLAREDLRDRVHDQVLRSIQAGATLHTGGKTIDGPGFFYEPTLLLNVQKGMAAYDEEVFGPVACVIAARDTEDAIRLANDTPYGLGAAVFTADLALGETMAKHRLHAGTCNVNTRVSSHPALPFGGTKQSGFGRELAEAGLTEFMNVKTVNLGLG